ncbi:MAG: hypothetical protein PHQ27_08535 [Victivallales bacterium]|nr:hypothetical protein [Victivallales bacterium]
MGKLMKIITGLLGVAILGGCGTTMTPADSRSYPYTASPERAHRIRANYRLLQPGMTPDAVIALLGEPDERNHRYRDAAQFVAHRSNGETWVYLLARRRPYGGMVERGEQSVRVEFNAQYRLLRTEVVGLPQAGPRRGKSAGHTGLPGAAY